MSDEDALITEDKWYKPSSPDMPARRFFIETGGFRWVVDVWRYTIKETGTDVYCAKTDEGHSAYGMTVNETLNDIKSIMFIKLGTCKKKTKTVSLEDVRRYLDPSDAAREDLKAAEACSNKSIFSRLLGL